MVRRSAKRRAPCWRGPCGPSIPSVAGYAFASPNSATDASFARSSALRIASHLPADQPHLSFVNATAQNAFATLDRVAQVNTYVPSVTYANNGFAQALRAIAGAIAKGIGTKVFWVQTGGYDTHALQNPNAVNGAYTGLMGTLNDGLTAFYRDLDNQGAARTLILQFSDSAAASPRTGATAMITAPRAYDGARRYGPRAASTGPPRPEQHNPTTRRSENNGGDVRHETDFRAVYSKVIESWRGPIERDSRGRFPGGRAGVSLARRRVRRA